MAVAYPDARLAVLPGPIASFAPAVEVRFELLPGPLLAWQALPEPSFRYEPFEVSFEPPDQNNFLTADGEVLTAGGESITW